MFVDYVQEHQWTMLKKETTSHALSMSQSKMRTKELYFLLKAHGVHFCY